MIRLFKSQFATLEQFQLHRRFIRDGAKTRYMVPQGPNTLLIFYGRHDGLFMVQYHEESGVTLYCQAAATTTCIEYCQQTVISGGYNV